MFAVCSGEREAVEKIQENHHVLTTVFGIICMSEENKQKDADV